MQAGNYLGNDEKITQPSFRLRDRLLAAYPDACGSPEPGCQFGSGTVCRAATEQRCDAAQVLKQLHETGSPATMAMAGPRFFGFVIGGALPVTVAAN